MTKQAAALSETQSADAMLRARAARVVPGGMWGHLNAARLPEGYPWFQARYVALRRRFRVWDYSTRNIDYLHR